MASFSFCMLQQNCFCLWWHEVLLKALQRSNVSILQQQVKDLHNFSFQSWCKDASRASELDTHRILGMETFSAQKVLPQVLFSVLWIVELVQLFHPTSAASNLNETKILLSLKNSLKDPMDNLQNWIVEDSSPCSWAGITCGNADLLSVVKLDLSSMNLSGSLSADVAGLEFLEIISLAHNDLSGGIPSNLFNITSLVAIDLSNNSLTGEIPRGFANLQKLEVLDLSDNLLTGGIPTDIGNQSALLQLRLRGNIYLGGKIPSQLCTLPNLQNLSLSSSSLVGEIPGCLGNLSQLQWLFLGWNLLSGPIPASLGNLQNIFWLDLSSSFLAGNIPPELGKLTNLTHLYLYNNTFSGRIPAELGKLIKLTDFDIGQNILTGSIPDELAGLFNLRIFHVYGNYLTGSFPSWLASLSNIYHIVLFDNFLSGTIPESLGRSSALGLLDLSTNNLSGQIPPDICHGHALFKLILFSNRLTGIIPESLGMCQSLARLRLERNSLSGSIPHTLFALPFLYFADFSENELDGTIDFELPLKSSSLTTLDLSHNFLSGSLASALESLPSLVYLYASNNLLFSVIPPGVGALGNLASLDLSCNALSDAIPPSLSNCSKLVYLNLSSNLLNGSIPSELGDMAMIGTLDLSNNRLEGRIPPQLARSLTLESIDLSRNNLSGPVPQSGIFFHLNGSSLRSNPLLCQVSAGSMGLKACTASDDSNRRGNAWKLHAGTSSAIAVLAITLVILVCCYYNFRRRYFNNRMREPYCRDFWEFMSFKSSIFQLSLEDIPGCLHESNVIGRGSAGTVYRCAMKDGQKVAVKRICVKEHGAGIRDAGIKAEVEILGSLRHRNIVQLLGCCFGEKENLLVYEYMPNGNLGDALHSHEIAGRGILLEWGSRLNIAIQTAQGLLYLHHGCMPPVLHRDVKCHNILLDAELNAHLADFGIAKFMNPDSKPETSSKVAGSHGYIAPEYAYTLKADQKADIYSFGVIMLELVTGRHPTDHKHFGDDRDIIQWLQFKLKTSKFALEEIVDGRLKPYSAAIAKEIKSALDIGLVCTSTSPLDRPSTQQVVNRLLDIHPDKKPFISSLESFHFPDSDFPYASEYKM